MQRAGPQSLPQPRRHGRLRRRLELWAALVLLSFLAGLLHYLLLGRTGSALEQGLVGAAIGGAAMGMEIFVLRGRAGAFLRRMGFLSALLLRTLLFGAAIVAALILSVAAFIGISDMGLWLRSAAFLQSFLYSLLVSVAVAGLAQISRLVGGSVLLKILLERYSRPVAEERIFLFLDLCDSTRIAEEVGDMEAYAFITGFFFDISDTVVQWDGETHAYVGDEVIVTWPLKSPAENGRAVACFFAIRDFVEGRAEHYRRRFGRVPRFRAGLHGGPVVAGECGDDKRQIVYLGDTVNTAARLEGFAKSHEAELAISEDLLSVTSLPAGIRAELLGQEPLRGRQAATRIYGLGRQES